MKKIKSKRRTISVIGFVVLVILIVLSYSSLAAEDKINLNFRGVDLRDAFRALADIAGMNVITDSTVAGTTTVNLKGVSFMESIELLTRTHGLGYRIIGNTVLIGGPKSLKKNFDKQLTKVFELKNAEPAEVKETVNLLVEDSSIRVDNRTRSIIVTAYEGNFSKIEDIVKKLDKAQKQIVMQVRMEEISYSNSEDLGINWDLNKITVGDDQENSGDSEDDNSSSSILTVGDVSLNYSSILNLLEKKGDATVLANPQITTMDGKEASINIGDEVPIVVTDEDDNPKVEFKDVGIILKINPRITGEDEIFINVQPEVSIVSGYLETSVAKYPIVSTRKAETNVRVKDGRTIAIGGLIKEEDIENMSKVPILGDIPILGKLFQNKSTSKESRELIIFITPKIIDTKDEGIKAEGLEADLKPFEYRLHKGDTLWTVAELFNISFSKIMAYNNIESAEKIEEGQKLLIPLTKDRYYRVKSNDTLKNIAKEYDLSIYKLKKINNLTSLKDREVIELVLPVAVKE